MKNYHYAGKLLPILFAIFSCSALISNAQSRINGSVKGTVADSKTKLPVEAAFITVKSVADAFVVQSTATNKDGTLLTKSLPAGQYELWISFIGYTTLKRPFTIERSSTIDLGIILLEQGINLNEVVVEADKAPVTVKKDTVEFNASSFKTQANDNVEELLKRLPGVEVDKDGKITAQGKVVKFVLVDGNEFFGNDPKAAIRNLPADAISKIQLIDDKTEQSKNTGIDNGQRDKVINLTIKEDKKKGWFGNVAMGGGSSDRYLGQMNMNRFNRNKQLSFLLMSNNVSQYGFSLEDLNNFSGGDLSSTFESSDGSRSIRVSRNGGADVNGLFSGVGYDGLIKTNSGGINFSNSAGQKKQFKFNGSYVAVLSSNSISKLSDIQDPLANELIYTNQSSFGENSSDIHRVNLTLVYKLDTLTTLKFKPNFSLSVRKNLTDQNYRSVNESSSPVNSGNQYFDQKTISPSFGGQLTLNKLISRNRGSVNLVANGSYNGSTLNYINRSQTKFTVSGAEQQKAFDQQSDQESDRSFVNGSLSYVASISKPKKLSLVTQNNFQYTNDLADQITMEYNPVSGLYETLVPSLTNNYNNRNWRNTTTIGISKATDKLNYTINAAAAYLGLSGEINDNPLSAIKKSSIAFVPNVGFSYRPKDGRNLSASINVNVNLPSVSNLQPVFNNTNPLYIRQGNPDLEMSRSVTGNFSYNTFDMKTNNSFNFYSNYTKTWNGFSTESTVDPDSRIQTVRPINIDGNYNLNYGISVGKPTKIKEFRIRYDLNGNLSRGINFINGSKNISDRLTAGFSGGIYYTKDRFSVSVDEFMNYNTVNNSFQSLSNQKYYQFRSFFNISGEPVKSFRIFCDLSLTNYAGANSSNLQKDILLMNSGIEKFFMKSRQLSLSLTGFDLFNQNSNIQRSVSATGRIEDYSTNILNRYMYLKLNYKLQKVGGSGPKPGSGPGPVKL